MDADLAVWEQKGSIPEEEFRKDRKRGVHYQIINHKLYREEDCMFLFRFVCSAYDSFKNSVLFILCLIHDCHLNFYLFLFYCFNEKTFLCIFIRK